MLTRKLVGFSPALILTAAFCGSLSAQITADVKGVVTDQRGASVPNAKITVQSKETGGTRVVTGDAEGRFAANQLKIGLYSVQAEAPGFRVTVTDAMLRSGETTTVNFKLEVGQVSESVTVTDAVSALDTTNAQIQVSIEGERIQDLAVGRNPVLFALTAPGVVPVTSNNPFLGSASYNSNGGRGRGNNVTVDNITSTDISTTGVGSILGSVNFSTIKEVKVITNNFSAEYGRNANSQLQIITMSGTNTFHGEAYAFLQNNELNARDFFDRSGNPAVTRRNQFGAVLGGPVIRNKTHFLFSYEGLQLRGAGTVRVAQVPTPAMLAQVTNATSKALLDLYKLPAATTILANSGQVQQSANTYTKAPVAIAIRMDHQISSKDSVTGRYSQYHQEQGSTGNTFIGTNIAGFGADSTNSPRQAHIAETHLFAPTVVNEFRVGFGRSLPTFNPQSPVLGPRIQFSNSQVDRFGESDAIPQGRVQNTYQVTDIISIVKGGHNVKLGVDVYRYQANSFFDSSLRGLYTFADWNGFAAGAPTTYAQNFGTSVRGSRIWNDNYFVQDDWKAGRNLTLNLGFRFENAHGTKEVNGLSSNLDLGCKDSMGAAGTGYLGCISVGRPSNNMHLNWGPRIGFAWLPTGSGKSVLRGGYGIAYDFLFLNPITNQRFLPPFISVASISGAGNFTGGNSWANLVAGTATIQQQTASQVGRISTTALNYGNVNPAIDPNLRNPMVQQWSIGIEHEVMRDLVLKVFYVGTKGDHLQAARNINLIADYFRVPPAKTVADETNRLPDFQKVDRAQNGNVALESNRYDPRFNNVVLLESSSKSIYHGFEVFAVKSYSKGLFFQASYTYGKSMDNGSDALGVLINDSPIAQNPNDLRNERAVSQFDVRQRLVLAHSWEPNLGAAVSNPLMRRFLSGWGMTGISTFRSGFPVTFDGPTRRGITPSSLTGSGAAQPVRPNASGPFSFDPLPAGSAGAPNGLNTDPFQPISIYAASLGLSQPLLGNFGGLGRNTHRLNGEKNFDWTIYKNTGITERVKLQLRCELYNIFNLHAFQDVVRNINSPTFGQYTTTSFNSRYLQVGARITF